MQILYNHGMLRTLFISAFILVMIVPVGARAFSYRILENMTREWEKVSCIPCNTYDPMFESARWNDERRKCALYKCGRLVNYARKAVAPDPSGCSALNERFRNEKDFCLHPRILYGAVFVYGVEVKRIEQCLLPPPKK